MRHALLTLLVAVAGCAVDDAEPVASQRAALRDLDPIEQGFLQLLNDYRVANGLSEVMADRALNQGARDYSQLMGETDHFDHTGPDGSSFDERMCDAGYDPACGPRTYVAENIAAGQRTAAAVFEAWRGSPGHNRNMLSSSAVVVGIGRAEVSGSRYGVYWTNTFGGQTTSNTVPNDRDAGPIAEPDAGPPPAPDAGTPAAPDAGSASGSDAGGGGDGGDAGAGDDDTDGGLIVFDRDGGGGGGGGAGAAPDGDLRLRGGCAAGGAGGGPPAPLLLALLGLLALRRRRPR